MKKKKKIRDVALKEVFTRGGSFFAKKDLEERDYPFLSVFHLEKRGKKFFAGEETTLTIYPNEKVCCLGCHPLKFI